MGRVNNTGVAVEVAAELGYLCAQFGNGFAFVLFTFAMIIVWTNRRKATIPFFMIFLGCFLLNLRIFVGMTMTFLKDTGLASAFVLKGLAFFKDALSALRSFPMLFLLITNIKAFLMVKFRWLGARVNIWVWTFILWCFINIPWYSVIQLARGTDSKQDMVLGQLMVLVTFLMYTVLAITSEFMYISMIWELVKMRECKPFIWALNLCEFFLYLSILSFSMGIIARLLIYLTLRDPSLPRVYTQIINAFGGDIAEAPFMMAVTFSMVVLTNSLQNAQITFLAQFSDPVAIEEVEERGKRGRTGRGRRIWS